MKALYLLGEAVDSPCCPIPQRRSDCSTLQCCRVFIELTGCTRAHGDEPASIQGQRRPEQHCHGSQYSEGSAETLRILSIWNEDRQVRVHTARKSRRLVQLNPADGRCSPPAWNICILFRGWKHLPCDACLVSSLRAHCIYLESIRISASAPGCSAHCVHGVA